jgi:chromosome segregation ATPase
MPVELAAARASELAQVAVLQNELQHVTKALEQAQARVEALDQELENLRTGSTVRERELLEQATEIERSLRDERALVEQELRTRNDLMETEKRAIEQEKHEVEKELLAARAEVARLEGRLESYSLGREKPLNVGLLLAVAFVFGVLVVVLIFIIAHFMA